VFNPRLNSRMNFIHAIPIEVRLTILFVLGCCAGAVINLGIYRLAWYPKSISPWSRPDPKAPPRRFGDRVPVIGWLGLRREAKLHSGAFWVRPMLLELLTGATFAVLYWWEIIGHGLVPRDILAPVNTISLAAVRHQQFITHAVLFCFMLAAFWIDVDEMSIPDSVTIPGTLLGLLLVTLWPYALLPESSLNSNGPFMAPMLTSVWLNSPQEVPPPPNNLTDCPRFLNPWEVPACMGWPALVGAIAIFCVWCLALAPKPERWRTRHGYLRAINIFTARMFRERMTYGLLGLAALGAIAISVIWSLGGPHWAGLLSGMAGIAVGGGLVWIVRMVASPVLHAEAMGFGDVTLLAMIGAYLGWQAAVIVFFLGPIFAVGYAVGRFLLRGEHAIPFGPYLCMAAVATILGWPGIWDFGYRYFSLGWVLIAVLAGALGLMVVLLPPVRWITERVRPNSSPDRP
jgi:leader peptidase (prepilin peptidase) / N-methyltransferase